MSDTKSLLREMLEVGVHFGHQTKFWNPKMKQYIYGAKNKIHIINLDKTVVLFEAAIKQIKQIVRNRGVILFVGTRSQASEIIAEEAVRSGMPYVDNRWLGGMLTNFETVKKSIKKLELKSALLEKSTEMNLSKKELLDLSREVAKLQKSIGGIAAMKKKPDGVFIIDTGYHENAIEEAKRLGIPVFGVVDTNNDPSKVDYVIPGNDDSAGAIRLYAKYVADTILAAKESVVVELAASTKLEIVEDDVEQKQKTVRRVKKAGTTEDDQGAINEDGAEVELSVESPAE